MTTKNLWYAIDYASYGAGFSKDFIKELRGGLEDYGLVVIDNIDLKESEYVELTKKIGDPLNLPKQLVPSKLPGYPEIARVGNFTAKNADDSGAIDPDYAFGHYWHHDGDFWPEGKNHIINLLHSKIVARSGGQTGFISTVAAYASLDDSTLHEVANASVVVDPANIEDFRGIPKEEWNSNVAGGRVEHPVVQDLNGQKSLYLPFFDYKLVLGSGLDASYDDLFKRMFDKEEVKYFHKWSHNQIVIWDNLKVMHRAMGNTKGKRLLWRAQGQILS